VNEEPANRNTRPLEFVIWSGLVLVMLAVTVAWWTDRLEKAEARRARQAREGRPLGQASAARELPVIGALPDFSLTNQSGQAVGLADLKGRVWLADIIFTRCAGPCPVMTRRMAELQSLLPAELPVGFLSLTTDPGFDTPPVLTAYGKRFGADPKRWLFLTGSKPEIARLATEGLKLVGREKAEEARTGPNDLFIHSTVFALVDRQGRLRGVRETLPSGGNDEDAPVVDPWETELKPEILKAIDQLVKEKQQQP